MQTPESRFKDQLDICQELSQVPPADYFHAGVGASWLLCLMQGIERLQQYALACEGVKFGYVYRDGSKASA